MKTINKKIVFTVLASCLLGMTQLALAEMKDLNKDEIIAAFSGKTAWGNHAFKDKRNMVYFAPDGTYQGKRLDESGSATGKWYVDDENRLCMQRDDGDARCRRVVDKKGKLKKYKGKKHVWNFTKIKDGNQIK